MADMTKKHYVLIADAISSGLVDLQEELAVDHKGSELTHLLRRVKMAMEDAFIERLRYTHDKWDANEFLPMVHMPPKV